MDAGDHNGQQEKTQIGAILERARRERGLSLREVEQATKIRTRYLEGLEREDYSALPDAVYVQGFLKTYANFLGLDGERLSRELKDQRSPRRERYFNHLGDSTGGFDRPLITPGGLGGAGERRISGTTVLTVALAVLMLAAVAGGLYLYGLWISSSQSGEAQNETPVESEPGPSASGTAGEPRGGEAATAQASDDAVQATVRVVDYSSGLTIRTDGTVAYEQVAQPGFSQTFQARDAITVEARNGGAVQVEVNGQDIGRLGSYGQPVTREFTPQSQG